MSIIEYIDAQEILDSRGNRTVEVDVIVSSGAVGRATRLVARPPTPAVGRVVAVRPRRHAREEFPQVLVAAQVFQAGAHSLDPAEEQGPGGQWENKCRR